MRTPQRNGSGVTINSKSVVSSLENLKKYAKHWSVGKIIHHPYEMKSLR